MKKIYIIYIILGIILCFSRCTTNFSSYTPEENLVESYVIQTRSEKLTKQVSKDIPLSTISASSLRGIYEESPYRYIGHGYKAGNGIIGDPDNLTFPIVDIKALLADNNLKDAINKVNIRSASSEVYAFSDYKNYLSVSKNADKISTKVSTPTLFPFKFGFERSFEDTFESRIERSKKQVMGLVNLFYKESNIKLNTSSYILDKVSEKYLSPIFIGILYNSSMFDIIQNYGGYVVCDYAVGGRAKATYLYNSSTDNSQTINAFKNTLGLSFGWGSTGSESSIGFHTERFKSRESSILKEWKKIVNKVQSDGGEPALVLNTSVANIEENRVDLSAWLQSLRESKNLVMVDINQRGLLGLDYFVIEENFQKLIRDINEGLDRPKESLIPKFTIERVSTVRNGRSTKQIAGVLNTRNGDKIIFMPDSKDNSTLLFDEEARRISEDISNIFNGIEIRGIPVGSINPLIRTRITSVVIPYELSELNWVKFKDPRTEVIYVYDSSKRIALSFYDEEYIPAVYGLSEWLKKVPERKISLTLLRRFYKVIGL